MRSGNTTPLCAIEDWSGAGFHTKQPLNVGQPIVSQVVSSPNNQSCLDPSAGLSTRSKGGCVCLIPNPLLGEATPHSERESHPTERANPQRRAHPVSAQVECVWSEGAVGRNGKQASASKILLSWARGHLWRWRHLQGSPSRHRTSESPVEFSFPPDADSCGL